jgi:phosphotransferase system HPr-like phosphotransfer protein
MRKVTLTLNEYNKAKKFNEIVSKFISDIDVVRGRYILDAKSFMALLTMDLSIPIDVILHSDDEKEIKRFEEVMEEFK